MHDPERFDLAIVGGGIAGLACAYAASKQGQRVLVLERDQQASGASIRNFGMIWPIGQPAGERLALALQSRKIWLELRDRFQLPLHECGSIHVAHKDDEWDVLQEFAGNANDQGYLVSLLSPREVLRHSPAVNRSGLLGGLYSSTECGVDPPQIVAALTNALVAGELIEIAYDSLVVNIEASQIVVADGRVLHAHRIIVAAGIDVQTLYPHSYRDAGLRLCKLHMLSTPPQPARFRIGPHLASGLTLRHYATFAQCKNIERVKQRVAVENPVLDQLGIHVMMSQPDDGRVILGDSHEYDGDISIFNNAEIDRLILDQLARVFALPDWTILRRWVGYYSKSRDSVCFLDAPHPNVRLLTGLAGNGMTLAMAIGQRLIETFDNPRIL